MKQWIRNNRKAIIHVVAFGCYTVMGGVIWLLAAGLLIGCNLDSIAIPVATTVMLLILITLSVRVALPFKTWVKTLLVQYAISLITHLLLIEALELVLSTVGTILLISWLDLPTNIWIKFGISLIELLGIGIRALWRKLKEKYGNIPF